MWKRALIKLKRKKARAEGRPVRKRTPKTEQSAPASPKTMKDIVLEAGKENRLVAGLDQPAVLYQAMCPRKLMKNSLAAVACLS